MEELDGPWVRLGVVRDGKQGSRGDVLMLSRGDVAVLCRASREPTRGGRGGKLDCGRGDGSRIDETKMKGSARMTSVEGRPGYAPDWTLAGVLV